MRNGTQAVNTLPAPYVCEVVEDCALLPSAPVTRSSAKRHMFFGFQNSKNTTVQPSEKRPAEISTRLLSILLYQNHCIAAKETPTTMIAGKTSNASFQLTMARTSQKGTMTAVIGRMRPIIAFMSASGN